jgi:hypothetical protein
MYEGLAEERGYQMLMHERTAHVAWVTEHGWKLPMAPRRRWRQVLAMTLVALAERIAPPVASARTSTGGTAQ